MSFDSFNFYEDSEPKTKKKIRKSYNDDEDSWNDDYNYFSRKKTTMRTRTKNLSKREIYLEQIGEDQLFNQCVQHARLLEYLELNNYYDIYDYVKHCNKKGVLLDTPIKQYFGESINIPNYNYYQQIEIHQRNFIQRQIEGLAEEVKKLKISKDTQPPQDSKNIFIEFYDSEAVKENLKRIQNENEQQLKKQQTLRRNLRDFDKKIKQQKQQNNNDKTKQYYEESPLDVPINEQIIKNCIVEFLQLNCEIVQNFQPQVIKKNNAIIEEIDYDSLSEDSLEEICSIHPKNRKNFKTLFFINRVQVIQVVPIINMQKDQSQIE